MEITIFGEPSFEVPLEPRHVSAIFLMSRHHYDATCMAASDVGGFVFGWVNSVRFSQESDLELLPFKMSRRMLDITCKIMENSAILDDSERDEIRKLTKIFYRAFSRSDEVSREWRVVEDF